MILALRTLFSAVAICTGLSASSFANELTIVNSKRIRLGDPAAPEWEWFANDPATQGSVEFQFDAKPNATEATLFIRQSDVKQEWRVSLNGKALGKLFLMEEKLVHSLAIPSGLLREKGNVLSIATVPGNGDDIVIEDVAIDPRPVATAIGQATAQVEIRDEKGAFIPARVTIVDEADALCPLVPTPGEFLAARPGVVYTGSGKAMIGLRAGKYTVYASRGFEHGVATQKFEVRAGKNTDIPLRVHREVATPGWICCDTHVHTLTLSGHGDSTLDERMLTIAGEGIELPIATEHNRHADYEEAAVKTGMRKYFTPVRGNEVTTARGHFNVFPVEPGATVPDSKLTAWPDLIRAMRGVSGVNLVLLNHPRSIHNKFRPFDPANYNTASGENPAGLDFGFDAMEVVNSGAQQSDFMLVTRDWFSLLNRGHRITAVGASDSHDVSRFIVGQARTYIVGDDADPSRLNIDQACENLRAGRAIVSMGLLPMITVDERFGPGDLADAKGRSIQIEVKVLGPSWVTAERVELFVNGASAKVFEIPAKSGASAGEKARFTWTLPQLEKDAHVVALATGPAVIAPFWAMTRPYQPMTPKWQGRSIGLTNPVWLDADGDGQFTAPNSAIKAP